MRAAGELAEKLWSKEGETIGIIKRKRNSPRFMVGVAHLDGSRSVTFGTSNVDWECAFTNAALSGHCSMSMEFDPNLYQEQTEDIMTAPRHPPSELPAAPAAQFLGVADDPNWDFRRERQIVDYTPPSDRFRGMTMTGKQFVADRFMDCLEGIADTIGIPHENIRILSDREDSWHVYAGDGPLIRDVEDKQRTRSLGLIQREHAT